MVRVIIIIAALFVRAGWGQTAEEAVRSAIGSVRYAPLAEMARVQGDVHVTVHSGMVTVVSGHPLLAETIVENAKSIASILDRGDLEATYHFVLADPTSVRTPTTVKRGNAFERAILRMFGLKTEKVVIDYQCKEGTAPPSDFMTADQSIEIWIYGTARCIQTNVSASV